MSKHNRWLDWKIRHGFATRGPSGPTNVFAGLLHRVRYGKYAGPPKGPQIFFQSVGGSMTPTGHGE